VAVTSPSTKLVPWRIVLVEVAAEEDTAVAAEAATVEVAAEAATVEVAAEAATVEVAAEAATVAATTVVVTAGATTVVVVRTTAKSPTDFFKKRPGFIPGRFLFCWVYGK
jgi:hypothetical protein